jgi:hypothetical protein
LNNFLDQNNYSRFKFSIAAAVEAIKSRRKAEGRRWKAEGGRQLANSSWQNQPEAEKVIANCILPFANLISTFTGKFYLILIYGNNNKYFA